ncbi:ComF family protein [Tenacibaculum jejuense]|uniref:Putative amidophosphoribosyl-transferase n=1 Tax=Tenacibaculum jejuense TaxID=584609 RepID=A0A238U4H0_9FLAO|nr:phosphoribosyltransferase family protein [Tenacibaculum jejuense]SNR13926.1 putative amidophosphoribosyl-transferase [Tenacibaculum jejuense]
MRFLKDLLDIFYPNLCINCENHLFSNEIILCSNCKNDLPIVDDNDIFTTNILKSLEVKKFSSLLYYERNTSTQRLIHHLKYKKREDVGVFLGEWFSHKIRKHNLFKNIDYVIPVPLHKKKFKKRGYNQVSAFAKCIAKQLNVSYDESLLVRVSDNSTQTKKSRYDRYNESSTKFTLLDTRFYEDKHILLVDDVITTGATLESCVKALLKTKNISISIATMAYTLKV